MQCYNCMRKIEKTDRKCPFCGADVDAEIPVYLLKPGTVLQGRYLVGNALGEGGFGITYIGYDQKLDTPVAIKEYFPNGYVTRNNTVSLDVMKSTSSDKKNIFNSGKDKFLSEARVLAKFRREHGIVEVIDTFDENNTAYIIMEYLDGETLKSYLKENGGKISPQKTLELLMPIMLTLKAIHKQNTIHRDISPDNIMLTNGLAKLLDFGSAREFAEDGNKSMSVMLKHGYAPPEQYGRKGNQGPQTDIYAICATMYKCITGITLDDASDRLLCDHTKTPSAFGIEIDKNFEHAIMKGISLKADDRFCSIDELIDGINGKFKYNNDAPTELLDDSASVTEFPLPPKDEPAPAPANNRKKVVAITASASVVLIAGVLCAVIIPKVVGGRDSAEISTESSVNPATEVSSITDSTNLKSEDKVPDSTNSKSEDKVPDSTNSKSEDKVPESVTIKGQTYQTNMTGSLDLTGRGLINTDIQDLKYFKNIDWLILDDNNITDLSCIAGLTQLKGLQFHRNAVKSLDFLRDFKNLIHLGIINNGITEISAVSNLWNLEYFLADGDNNNFSSVSALKFCTKLKKVSLSNSFVDISVFENMSDLEYLRATNCGLVSIEALRNCVKLKEIYIWGNNLTDLTPLAACKKIGYLDASYNNLNGNLSALDGLNISGFIILVNDGYTADDIFYHSKINWDLENNETMFAVDDGKYIYCPNRQYNADG